MPLPLVAIMGWLSWREAWLVLGVLVVLLLVIPSAVLVRRRPEEFGYRNTVAWALFANGLHDEAIAEAEKALELAPEQIKDDYYQRFLDRMRTMVDEARAAGVEQDESQEE